jgi:hypothetical protein
VAKVLGFIGPTPRADRGRRCIVPSTGCNLLGSPGLDTLFSVRGDKSARANRRAARRRIEGDH